MFGWCTEVNTGEQVNGVNRYFLHAVNSGEQIPAQKQQASSLGFLPGKCNERATLGSGV